MQLQIKNYTMLSRLAGLSILLVSLPLATAPPPPYVYTQLLLGKNLNEKLLVLDYESLSPGSVVDAEEKCAAACRAHLGCNGYTYCGSTSGCGTGCISYVTGGHQALPLPPTGQSNYKTQPLPIERFSPFTSGPKSSGCDVVNPDKWRFRTCSLKKVAKPTSPAYHPDSVSQGWTSGVVYVRYGGTEVQGFCDGVPFDMCNRCMSYWMSKNYDQCMDCAKSVTSSLGSAGANTLEKSVAPWACSWCFTTKPDDREYDRSKCFACVKTQAFRGLPQLCAH